MKRTYIDAMLKELPSVLAQRVAELVQTIEAQQKVLDHLMQAQLSHVRRQVEKCKQGTAIKAET